MEINGVLAKIKEVETIPTKTEGGKDFQKREFWVQTQEQYPQTISIELHGEKTGLLDNYAEGQEVTVAINLKGRVTADGKCFNTLQAWRIQLQETAK
jgi:single-strand DNA-binding protein